MGVRQRTGEAHRMELGHEGSTSGQEELNAAPPPELSAFARCSLDADYALGRTMGICESSTELRLGPLGGLGKSIETREALRSFWFYFTRCRIGY